MLNPQRTLNCNGQLLSLATPVVMGILNVTPDSFYDGGRFVQEQACLLQVEQMLEEGAQLIDIGGMSSRPGAALISVEEELQRTIPVIEQIRKAFPTAILSIDTVRAKVARAAAEAGASIVNDISAGRVDPDFYETVADLHIPYVLMHMQGKPQTMQTQPVYDNVVLEVLDFMIAEVGKLRALGVKDIIVDVGFGFGKTITHNFELLKRMHVFQLLDLPVLAGLSRKSMIYKTLDTTAEAALVGTAALHVVALQQGASILRAHDVKEACEVIQLWQRLDEV